MTAGLIGAYVISWSQTEIDGLEDAPVTSLDVGSTWAWRGEMVRVDGPADVLQLDRTVEASALRKRAALMVKRLLGAALDHGPAEQMTRSDFDSIPVLDTYFCVTDGAQTYTVSVIPVGKGSAPLVMFIDKIPPRRADLWVVSHALNLAKKEPKGEERGGVICFTPGTLIETTKGLQKIEDLREGDRVSTRDSGAQDILWIGQRHMSGARLYAMPHLRPIRIRSGALAADVPDCELIVSPEHRMLIGGKRANDLFNETEVLASAKDLVDNQQIYVDRQLQSVTYVHFLLPSHHIISANGVLTESFHPASAALSALEDSDHARLLEACPDISSDPYNYGAYARRNLSSSEVAILRHAA